MNQDTCPLVLALQPPFGMALGSSWAVCFGTPMICHRKWTRTVCPHPWASKMSQACASCQKATSPFGMNFSELLNIQKRDCPGLGPSFRNSWPSPFPHLPQDTWQDHKTTVQWPLLPSVDGDFPTPISQSNCWQERLTSVLEPHRKAVLFPFPSGPQAFPGVWGSSSPG